MATMEAISAALKLTDSKKLNLRKAFDDLNSLSSPLSSSFNLNWSDIDAHFSSIHAQLQQKFRSLEAQTPKIEPKSSAIPTPPNPSSSSTPSAAPPSAPAAAPETLPLVEPRPELKALCAAMDGPGLRKFMDAHYKERIAMRREIPRALACSPDPAALVLGAMGGFFPGDGKGDKDQGVSTIRRNCILLLEEFLDLKAEVKPEVRENARKLALDWKGKVTIGGENSLEALGFLHLLAAYGLESEFDMGYVVDLFVIICQYRQAVKLSRVLVIADRVPDLIKKLIGDNKHLLAVKFIFEYNLANKFPPVPLLKAFVVESKNVAKKVRKDGNHSLQSLNEATAKEISALKQVVKYIEDHNLESEYSKENLEKRIEQLEKQKAERKRPAASTSSKQRQNLKKLQQNGGKRLRVAAPGVLGGVFSSAGASSTVSVFKHPHMQSAGLLPDPYLNATAGPYGVVGSAPTVASYAGSSAGLYDVAGSSTAVPGELSPIRYTSGSHIPTGYYSTLAYGSYNCPPQYNSAYYAQ